jgi:sec-independent protein translocase protein TatA
MFGLGLLGLLGLGLGELIILVGILVLFFGAKKIPELTRSIGESIRYIKNGFSDKKGNKTDKNN